MALSLRHTLVPFRSVSHQPHFQVSAILSRQRRLTPTPSRSSSTASAQTQTDPKTGATTLSARWLSDTKSRIGRCITFGLTSSQTQEASSILQGLGQNWRNLVAGSEGFLTDYKRAGLHRQNIVWGEQDSMGHVNNVMYVRYAESGRCNWTRNIGTYFDLPNQKLWAELLSSRGVGLILKSITVDFKFPMTWPDKISVYHKLRHRPDEKTESMVLDVMILSETKQRPAARCLEDVVVYDYTQARKTKLEPFMVKQFKDIFERQEQAKRENLEKVEEIERRVKDLEKRSWDCEGAKEDLGSAAKS